MSERERHPWPSPESPYFDKCDECNQRWHIDGHLAECSIGQALALRNAAWWEQNQKELDAIKERRLAERQEDE